MATAQTIPAAATVPAGPAGAKGPAAAAAPGPALENTAGQALMPAPQNSAEEPETLRGPVTWLPVEVDVVVPVEEFRVRDLLALAPGRLIPSGWNYGEDVPLAAGEVQLAWSEFEVIDGQLGVRITRLP